MMTWDTTDSISPFGRMRQVDDLMELFHEQTKITSYGLTAQIIRATREADRPENRFRNSLNYKLYAEHEAFQLPDPMRHDMALSDAFQSRRSGRGFSGAPVSLQDLSDVLLPALQSHEPSDGVSLSVGRPYPSGGAMYPVEHYILACNVDGLPRGAYYLNHRESDLRLVAAISDFTQVQECFTSIPGWLDRTGFIIVQTALLERSTVKYGPRGYRLALIEGGCAVQNLSLTFASKGLASVVWAGFIDDSIAGLLGINVLDEIVLTTIVVGNRETSEPTGNE